MADLIGQSLGRYQILERLGEGGMAVVYKARDTRLQVDVAVKVIRVENLTLGTMDRTLKRFEREARALARLTHPNIVKVTDYGEYENMPYLVMPLLLGGTLKSKLSGKPMPYQDALQILIPIAEALGYAHKQDIIHRDVKPANILITENDQPMLADFGVAKILDVEETMELTGTGVGLGTPEYMAPEQVTNKLVDARADIYALGVVLFEMVTGRKPFIADTPMAVLIMHSRDPLPRPKSFAPNLPQSVENILLKALAKNPNDRYQSMAEFAKAMEQVVLAHKKQSDKATQRKDRAKNYVNSFKSFVEKLALKNLRPSPRQTRFAGILALALISILGIVQFIRQNPSFDIPALAPSPQAGITSTLTATVTFTPTRAPTSTSTLLATQILSATDTPLATVTSTLGIGSTTTGIDRMTLLYVAAGDFIMGSDNEKTNDRAKRAAKPVHTVYLDAYWIDETEVTNATYALCVQSGKCVDHSEAIRKANPNFDTSVYANPLYANYAVVHVTWKDAAAYCEWAGRRLPTEAEWEKAASWDDTTKTKRIYPWGDTLDCSYVDYYDGNRSCGGGGPVKSFERGKSPYGAYDMTGNVSEWVNDWYSGTYYQNSPTMNPLGPDSGAERVVRNGFDAALRGSNVPGFNAYTIGGRTSGFRCAQSADKINADQTPVPVATAKPPYPTTTPISFHVQPATNLGDRFTATADGIYRFTIEKGAVRACLPNPNLPDCGTWNSQLQVFKNRDILWGSFENRNVPRVAANTYPLGDYTLGVYYPAADQNAAEKANIGRHVDIPLKTGDYLIIIPSDCQSCYDDNEGGVDLSVSIVGALP